MSHDKLRQQIAVDAARLMYFQQEPEYYRAKLKAARRISGGWVKPQDLPSNSEIRDQMEVLARIHQVQRQSTRLRQMRSSALHVMQLLAGFCPRLVGGAVTGNEHEPAEIDIHVFHEAAEAVAAVLTEQGIRCQAEPVEDDRSVQHLRCTPLRAEDEFPLRITVHRASMPDGVIVNVDTGESMIKTRIDELETLLAEETPPTDIADETTDTTSTVDRFHMYELLLLPLEHVKQSPKHHPEGDALYHSLQVFDLARDELPYDEEFLLAALLHDVGKAVDSRDHVQAGLEALDGYITERTAWLIAHHIEANALRDGTLGVRSRRRLEEAESFEELTLLSYCDRRGRQKGVEAPNLEEAIEYLKELSRMCG